MSGQMNLANTPHFYGSQVQWLLVPNKRYQWEVMTVAGQMQHLESFALWVGKGLGEGDFIEIEMNPYGSCTRLPHAFRTCDR